VVFLYILWFRSERTIKTWFNCMPTYHSIPTQFPHMCPVKCYSFYTPDILYIRSLHKRVLHYQKHQIYAWICVYVKDDTVSNMFYTHLCYLMQIENSNNGRSTIPSGNHYFLINKAKAYHKKMRTTLWYYPATFSETL
jgi:hypothetical protein